MPFPSSGRPGLLAAVFLFLLLEAAPAYAYVDPGTGGMLVQLLLGGVIGALVLFRSGWQRVIGWFRRSSVDDGRRDN